MKKVIIITVFVVFGFNLFAQNNIDSVLKAVEKNNTTLLAFRKNIDAEKIGNKTGLTPQNPEVEFNYLFGKPSAIGNRTDFSIKQSFDFPTVYSYKSQISDLKNDQLEIEYKKVHNDILYQTHVVCAKLTYQNALKVALQKKYANALQIAEAYKSKFNTGDIGILDYNKSQIQLVYISKELENIEIERNLLLSELTMLNGGTFINFTESQFFTQALPTDFEQWFAQIIKSNPLMQWVTQEIAISEQQVKLNNAMNLPKLYAGYMNEKVVGEQFQGVTVGVTIPLWENKNTTKYAKAKTIAVQEKEIDTKLQFYSNLQASYNKAITLQKSVEDYRQKLALYSNVELLKKAFDKGEISLTEYMYELSLYYESVCMLYEMELSYNLAIIELYKNQ